VEGKNALDPGVQGISGPSQQNPPEEKDLPRIRDALELIQTNLFLVFGGLGRLFDRESLRPALTLAKSSPQPAALQCIASWQHLLGEGQSFVWLIRPRHPSS
jgi:hypothetical protein